MKIDSPLIIVFENDGKIQTHLYPGELTYREYAVHISALVRHVAKAFKALEADVWDAVDEERDHPTTPVSDVKIN